MIIALCVSISALALQCRTSDHDGSSDHASEVSEHNSNRNFLKQCRIGLRLGASARYHDDLHHQGYCRKDYRFEQHLPESRSQNSHAQMWSGPIGPDLKLQCTIGQPLRSLNEKNQSIVAKSYPPNALLHRSSTTDTSSHFPSTHHGAARSLAQLSKNPVRRMPVKSLRQIVNTSAAGLIRHDKKRVVSRGLAV